ncbi:hypothetical protein E2C01_088345 [Portunus trituberculatus]|uniref:Uncharacterized protein n=1 Tax=Portunus trituberculatus TaxID=210409 RepID=A0A5B7JAH6_PORTR|nr:hypothetical protein [Portunus trituberculatus]
MYLKAAPILCLLAVAVAVMVVEGYPTFAKQDYPALNVDQYDLAMSVIADEQTLSTMTLIRGYAE